MDEIKYVQKLLEVSNKVNIEKFRLINNKEDYQPFEGSPKRHPANDNILVLLTNPFDKNKMFYEFHLDTISAVEELGTVTSEKDSIYQVRVWVKKGAIAVRSETFIV